MTTIAAPTVENRIRRGPICAPSEGPTVEELEVELQRFNDRGIRSQWERYVSMSAAHPEWEDRPLHAFQNLRMMDHTFAGGL